MHTKLILPGSYAFEVPALQMVKVASGGLRGDDLKSFIKRAGAKMADAMQHIQLAPGEVPIHLIAIGATEWYGPNRNGDGFTEACCRKYHPTFKKYARWYRNHQNKDTSKSYGIVKHSSYNEDMHRIELIVALNGTKEAARRNKGLLADKELEKIASDKEDWGVSMACKVAYDVCSVCGNKAPTRADYCTGIEEGGSCPGGGCKNNMCKVAEDGTRTYVDNPHPSYFDISDVYKPADYIAYVFGKMVKAASGRVMGGSELAEQARITVPFELAIGDVTDRRIREQMKLASELATIEDEIISRTVKCAQAIPDTTTCMTGLDTIARDPKSMAQALKAMAREKISMSLADFLQFTSGSGRAKAEYIADKVQWYVPGVFNRMCANPEKLASALANNPFRPSAIEPTMEWQKWAIKQAPTASFDIKKIQKRAWVQTIRDEVARPTYGYRVDDINDSHTAYMGIADAYGLYKLAFLDEIRDSDPDFALTANLVVRQNYI